MNLPKGFIASGVASGVKKNRPDLGLVLSEKDSVCAGFFTSNKVKAASLLLTKALISRPFHRAVIMNSGCANCLTGKAGLSDAGQITKEAARLMGIKQEKVLICSTGIIGKRLNKEKIMNSLPKLITSLSAGGLGKFSRSIMTTDTWPKIASRSFKVNGKQVKITGVAKGAGMISPNMATMLCVIMTDADISKSLLRKASRGAVYNSFNCVTVDGDMSTNDTVLVLANAAAKVKINANAASYKQFAKNLSAVALDLAKMIAKDGEGATKFIEISIKGAKTVEQAKKAAFEIANSNLVKTAIYGNDPNIGRVASACGASGIDVKQEKLDIYFNSIQAVKKGIARNVPKLRKIFKGKDIKIECNLNLGKKSQTVYTCDLSADYVKINAEYN
ncbi:MAG: bifunctional glutamate N-acetyltransferase/amino-acid acetyltransferase ArgJ [Candidatus Omnitrophica bacterium]|nr:bifunctional glutamate N-acetyltransferase/amino-acid acetyltransferase ArgJ [Candidatus Omnitrophota bacterium]